MQEINERLRDFLREARNALCERTFVVELRMKTEKNGKHLQLLLDSDSDVVECSHVPIYGSALCRNWTSE